MGFAMREFKAAKVVEFSEFPALLIKISLFIFKNPNI